MEITTDLILKGGQWRKTINALAPFFPQYLQPVYSVFVLSMSIGIMYDKQLDMAGDETPEERETRPSVPRNVLHPHNNDLDFLFQSAVLASSLVSLNEKDRIDLAFNPSSKIQFNKLEFLSKFANFGVGKLLEQISDENLETMDNIKKFLANTIEGTNYEIDSVSEEELDLDDIELQK